VLLLCATLGGMLVYNKAVTGHPLHTAYALYESKYAQAPSLWILPENPPKTYSVPELRRFWQETDLFYYRLVKGAPIVPLIWFLQLVVPTLVCVVWIVPLVFSLAGWNGRKPHFALLIAIVFALPCLAMKAILAQYIAPAVGLLLLFLAAGLRVARLVAGRSQTSALAPIALAAGSVVVSLLLLGGSIAQLTDLRRLKRQTVLDQLHQQPGPHLVIVRYAPDHDTYLEWVYNGADIDGSNTVWARDLGAVANRPLLDYYRNRRVWILEPDKSPVELRPFDPASD
jgi:hypothetical protein